MSTLPPSLEQLFTTLNDIIGKEGQRWQDLRNWVIEKIKEDKSILLLDPMAIESLHQASSPVEISAELDKYKAREAAEKAFGANDIAKQVAVEVLKNSHNKLETANPKNIITDLKKHPTIKELLKKTEQLKAAQVKVFTKVCAEILELKNVIGAIPPVPTKDATTTMAESLPATSAAPKN